MPSLAARERKRELHDLVAEVLRIGDAGRLFDLGELVVERCAVEQLAGVGVLEVLVFDPGIGIGDVAVEQVLAVLAVGFQIGLLDFLADELGIARRQSRLDEFEIFLLGLFGILLALDRLLEHIHQMHRIGGDSVVVVVEGLRQHLVGEAGRDAVMPSSTPAASRYSCSDLGLGVGVLQLLAVIDAHLGVEVGVLVLLEPRHHAELRQHLERFGRAGRCAELAASRAASCRSASLR